MVQQPEAGKASAAAREVDTALTLAYGALALLVAVRLLVTPWPTMWPWGLNTQRFLAVPLAFSLWAVMALPFIGPVGAWWAETLERLGNRLASSSSARLTAATVFALVVFLLDDRTMFTGDSLIRRVASDSPEFLARFKQSLPLELLLFERLPLAIQGFLLPAGMLPRLVGMAAAFAIAMAGLRLGREHTRRGVALVAVACVVCFGGYLAVCTGLGKPAALLAALTAITALLSLRVATSGRVLAPLGWAMFAALVLHRAGALLLPCWLLALGLSLRRGTRESSVARGTTWVFALLPLAALAVVGPRLLHIVLGVDLPYHMSGAALIAGGPPSPLAAPWRLLDLVNLSLLLVPAGLPLLMAATLRPGAWLKTRETAVLLALLAPWLIIAAIARPVQGVFRDLDFFAPGAVAFAAQCAWILSRLSASETRFRRLAAAITMTSVASTLQLLCCFHDPASGLARVRAYLSEAPRRSAGDYETTWDFLALRSFALRDWPLAADACAHAARLAPSPRLLMMLGIARTYTGDYAGARQAYARVIERSPNELVAWAGLAGLAARINDSALADSALAHVRKFPRTSAKARELRRVIEQYPEFWPCAPR